MWRKLRKKFIILSQNRYQNHYGGQHQMLEIVFTKGKVGAEAVRIFVCGEKSKPRVETLPEHERLILTKALRQAKFEGKKGQIVEILGGRSKIIVIGTGEKVNAVALQEVGGMLAKHLFKDSVACCEVQPIKGCRFSEAEIACQLAFGIMLGSYRFDKYFTKKKADEYPALEQVIFRLKDDAHAHEIFKPYAALANAVRYGRDLCNEPANYLTPQVFADDIERLKYLGLDIEILDKKQLEEKGFGLLLGVAQGSVNEPRVAVLQWKGRPDQDTFDLALVGKGVTFDSGGISLKPGAGMGDMKGDMTGAAVVTASLKALALQAAPVNVAGIVGLVENMPSGSAIRPGDILTSLSGQTVEVLNTDAEGRLVLGDCLTYIQEKLEVKEIIDIATLTGATMRALGSEYAGIFANDDKLSNALVDAGEKSGEHLWRLPINKAYDKMIDSPVADMKNIGGANAGGSTAACFLQRFIREGVKWAHLDIAGVDRLEKNTALCPKGATAFGIRLLNTYLQNR